MCTLLVFKTTSIFYLIIYKNLKIMKLEKLKLEKQKLTKEAMTVTFGGYGSTGGCYTNCGNTCSGGGFDCTDYTGND